MQSALLEIFMNPSEFVSVSYIIATGGSGCTRMRLSELPQWLRERAGHLVYEIRVLGF